ncbi:unnamed protein product [Rotaria sordida]|uniref:Uncharacterized protein n=1 Tax=Rotaria sordida TaxID=392033 RepID=A0A819T904_9BILA|nr:unnamed protein product [Rotaria sordida]
MLTHFCRSLANDLSVLLEAAAITQLNEMDEIIQGWMDEHCIDRRDPKLKILLIGPRTGRQNNLQSTYFERLLGSERRRNITETTLDTINGNDRIESTLSQGTNVTRSQLIPSDQLYRQAKIYEENRLTRGGELPEGAAESGNEDNDHDVIVGKNKKYDPHRALNIDLSEKPIQSIPTSPPLLTSQLKEPVPKQIETPPILTGKPKKSKKKKIIEKQEQSSTLKSKHKRERSDYKELLSPADEEENCPTSTPPPSAIAKKPKKKNHRQKQTTSIGHYDR